MQVILEGLSVPIQLHYESPLSYRSLRSDVLKSHRIDLSRFCVYLSGRLLLSDESRLPDTEPGHITVLRVQVRVLGGKGGFGSQLKAIGAQIQKTTNKEACRDLSGRRVRDVNAEKAFSAMAREEKRRMEERLQQKLRRREKRWAQRAVPPKLEDPVYYQSLEENEDRVSAALKHAQHLNGKRPHKAEREVGGKRPVFRGMDGELSISESDQEEERMSTVNTDIIPPITSVEQISNIPQPTQLSPEIQPKLKLMDTEREIEHDNIQPQPQTQDESPTSSNSPDITNDISDHVSTPQISAPLVTESEIIDLETISTKEELEKFGLESLKQTLISLGLKCGGTLQERAGRLYTYKVLPKDQLPTFLFAGKGKGQAKKADK